MRRSRRLATAFFLLAPIAAAQNSPSRPAEVFGLKLSNQEGEVRIELSTSATVPSAEVIATYRDTLILDLPGAVYHALPRRLQVNHAGIRAVRLWMQSENPPLTRVVVEIDRTEHRQLVASLRLPLRVQFRQFFGPVLAKPGSIRARRFLVGSLALFL